MRKDKKDDNLNLIEEINKIEIKYTTDLFNFLYKINSLINVCKDSKRLEQLIFFKHFVEDKMQKTNIHKNIEKLIIFGKLPPRQIEIVEMIYNNPTLTAEEIAENLYISKDTVNQHLKNIIDSLNNDKEIMQLLKDEDIKLDSPLTTIRKIRFLQFDHDFMIKYAKRCFENLAKYTIVKNGKTTKTQQTEINNILTAMNNTITKLTNYFS